MRSCLCPYLENFLRGRGRPKKNELILREYSKRLRGIMQFILDKVYLG